MRIVAREAVLMTPVLDGLGPLASRKPLPAIYEHILKCDRNMRLLIQQVPPFLLRDAGPPRTPPGSPAPAWLHTARRTLAISAADKIIMIHRPVLFYSFANPAFANTRTTCTAAAMTILREHEAGRLRPRHRVHLDPVGLLHHRRRSARARPAPPPRPRRPPRPPSTRHALAKAADRLRARRLDVLAAKAARLIDVFLAVEERPGRQGSCGSAVAAPSRRSNGRPSPR